MFKTTLDGLIQEKTERIHTKLFFSEDFFGKSYVASTETVACFSFHTLYKGAEFCVGN
jgi:hypothetical protein